MGLLAWVRTYRDRQPDGNQASCTPGPMRSHFPVPERHSLNYISRFASVKLSFFQGLRCHWWLQNRASKCLTKPMHLSPATVLNSPGRDSHLYAKRTRRYSSHRGLEVSASEPQRIMQRGVPWGFVDSVLLGFAHAHLQPMNSMRRVIASGTLSCQPIRWIRWGGDPFLRLMARTMHPARLPFPAHGEISVALPAPCLR
jgi:hypothetical protein